MKKFFLTILCLIALPLIASHIVGGEIELLYVSGNTYRMNLILYFDKNNGNPGAKDQSVTANIYRKSDNTLMKTVVMPLSVETAVGYTQPACSSGEISTDKIVYTALVSLPSAQFNDPAGYYVAWERCCRNYSIVNIYSQNPNGGTGNALYAGQTFYLQFPAVVKNGSPFINSSPHLFPPLNDYACVNRPYYVDFAGVDDDGDSLVYSLVTPFNTHSGAAPTPTLPAEYPPVTWRPGYSLNQITKGNPDMRITRDGLLTVTPSNTVGLFVFAVKVEEFRNKEKIGESRRDFQMLVIDCKIANPPKIVGKKLTDTDFTYDGTMNVTFSNQTTDENRCIQVQVSDPDSKRIEEGFSENIKIRVIGLDFKSTKLNSILPAQVSATLTNGSTKDFRICFPQCPFTRSGTYSIGIIAMDDACSLPLLDTLRVNVTVQPPLNHDPYFTTPTVTTDQISEGETGTWPFEVKDDDGDELTIYVEPEGFKLEDIGMKLTVATQQAGYARGQLVWDAYCDKYDFSKRTEYKVKLKVDDGDQCKFNDPVIADFDLRILLPGNADPTIDTDLTPDPEERYVRGLQRQVGQSFSFKVTGSDVVDNDLLVLRMVPVGFKAADYGMTFQRISGRGVVQSGYQWSLICTKLDLKKKDDFEMMFIVVDSTNKCRLRKADTVNVEIKIVPDKNAAPVLNVASKNADISFQENQVIIAPGAQIVLSLEGSDADDQPQRDSVYLSLKKATGNRKPEGYTFANAKGLSSVSSTFVWTPDCSVFQDGVYDNNYSFLFYLHDNHCQNVKADSLEVKIKVKDKSVDQFEFLPVNVFTPNGDGVNDYYALQITDESTGEIVDLLPQDNCISHFESIRIYNRWGSEVFVSRDREFRWYGKEAPAGVYFYLIKYNDKDYKGAVSLRN